MDTSANPTLLDGIVIGAGVGGLAAATGLHRRGASLRVLECASRVGGAVASVQEDGYLAECGPNSLLINDGRIEQLLEFAGLNDEIVVAGATAKKRFLVRDAAVLPVPMSPPDLISTTLFSARAKARLLAEPWIARGKAEDESLADFVTRRLGREVLDQAVQPLVSGIYAGDPARLSVRHAFPTLHRLESESGSLFAGLLKSMRQPSPHRVKRRLMSLRHGLGALPQALARKLGDRVATGVRIDRITRQANGVWTVAWTDAGGVGQCETTKRLIVTVPAFALASLPWGDTLRGDLSGLAEIPYAPVTVVVTGLARERVKHPLDGFGVLIPERERMEVLGCLFSSTLFPGRAPEGQVLLTSFLGGRLHPDRAEGDNSIVLERALGVLRPLLGVEGMPDWCRVFRWPRAIPQLEMGHERFVQIMESVETRWPGLVLAGSYRHGISVPQCLLGGLATADY